MRGALVLGDHHPRAWAARIELEGLGHDRLCGRRGIAETDVRRSCYANALAAYGQSGQMQESDWLDPPAIDQRTLYEGNSILRGGREPETPVRPHGKESLIIE